MQNHVKVCKRIFEITSYTTITNKRKIKNQNARNWIKERKRFPPIFGRLKKQQQ